MKSGDPRMAYLQRAEIMMFGSIDYERTLYTLQSCYVSIAMLDLEQPVDIILSTPLTSFSSSKSPSMKNRLLWFHVGHPFRLIFV